MLVTLAVCNNTIIHKAVFKIKSFLFFYLEFLIMALLIIILVNNLMHINKNKVFIWVLALITGVINSLLGAGGGMITVPLLKKAGFSQKQAQANAIAIILPLSILSSGVYLWRGNVNIFDALPYIPGGILGAFLGTKIFKKISNKWLKRIFGGFMLWAGLRLLFK